MIIVHRGVYLCITNTESQSLFADINFGYYTLLLSLINIKYSVLLFMLLSRKLQMFTSCISNRDVSHNVIADVIEFV